MKEIIAKSLLSKIERLEAFEDRVNIKIENISIKVYDGEKIDFFLILFEVHPKSGTKIQENIEIECVLYNKDGAILQKENKYIREKNFFGFEVIEFGLNMDGDIDQIGKIRIYPKKM